MKWLIDPWLVPKMQITAVQEMIITGEILLIVVAFWALAYFIVARKFK